MENKKKEPIKVLTIDFDYIMSPCIKLYNDMAAENNNPTEHFCLLKSRHFPAHYFCSDWSNKTND